jgi:hypothetical protein
VNARKLAAVGILATGVCVAVVLAQGGLTGLGVQETAARRDVLTFFTSGYLNAWPAFKAAAPASRPTMVRNALAWARAYTESAAFKAEYEKERAAHAPTAPKARKVDEELAKQKADRLKGLADSKKALEKMPADMRAQMEATIKQMEAQFAKMDSDPQMVQMARQGLEMQIADEQRRYGESVKRHELQYPADPRQLIARRLREFVGTIDEVDFSAKLVPVGGRMKFADPRYEAKNNQWKLFYRAGKDVMFAARGAAAEWLKQVEAK